MIQLNQEEGEVRKESGSWRLSTKQLTLARINPMPISFDPIMHTSIEATLVKIRRPLVISTITSWTASCNASDTLGFTSLELNEKLMQSDDEYYSPIHVNEKTINKFMSNMLILQAIPQRVVYYTFEHIILAQMINKNDLSNRIFRLIQC